VIEYMDKKERRDFDAKLSAPPPRVERGARSRDAAPRSSGTKDLMAAFGTGRR
jgi:hypothetical protein